MKCCDQCFSDLLITTIIVENQEIGNCNYCGSEDVFIIDVDELTEYFDNLFKLYEITEPYEYYHPEIHDDPIEFGDRLINLINEDWNIFSELIEGTGIDEKLLFDILNSDKGRKPYDYIDLYSRITESFTFIHPAEEWEEVWENFKEELKHTNRFFPQLKDTVFGEKFDVVLRYRQLILTEGFPMYRARLGEQPKEKMLNPPPDIAKQGRANPHGISYLYCAVDEETCIAEIRPWKGAKVTVAEIRVKRDLKLVNLRWESICPFLIDSPDKALEIDSLLKRFSYELSKPVDPNKSEIEYLPTQYITELIKSKGYDGICFQSSLGSGFNFVLFDEKNVEVVDVKYFVINNISYQYN
jgi:hypothetical protein